MKTSLIVAFNSSGVVHSLSGQGCGTIFSGWGARKRAGYNWEGGHENISAIFLGGGEVRKYFSKSTLFAEEIGS